MAEHVTACDGCQRVENAEQEARDAIARHVECYEALVQMTAERDSLRAQLAEARAFEEGLRTIIAGVESQCAAQQSDLADAYEHKLAAEKERDSFRALVADLHAKVTTAREEGARGAVRVLARHAIARKTTKPKLATINAQVLDGMRKRLVAAERQVGRLRAELKRALAAKDGGR